MSGLHVPLDVEYAADDKVMDAGPMAELLYIRGLAFCKRTMSDGHITDRQLASVALGIPGAKRHAQRLVDVGLWTRGQGRWTVVNWLKYNAPASDIEAARDMAKANGVRGNHERWHLDENGALVKPSPRCALCRAMYRPPDRPPDGVPDRVAHPNPIGGDIAKEEPEPEPEEEPEEEPEPEELKEPNRSSVTSLREAPDTSRDIGATVTQLAARFHIGEATA